MLRVKNWASFQSYKDRKPPWIRLHKSLLDNFDFHTMSANARAILPMLWLLASEDGDPVSGLIRESYERISFRLRIPESDLEAAITEFRQKNFVEEINEQGQIVTEFRNEDVTKFRKSVTSEKKKEQRSEVESDLTSPLDSTLESKPSAPSDDLPKKTKKGILFSPAFLLLWSAWKTFEMEKGSKFAAAKSYEKVTASGISPEVILAAAQAYCSRCMKFQSKTKHVSTWLNQRGWEDDNSPPPSSGISARQQALRGAGC